MLMARARLAALIRDLRRVTGLTQKEFGERLTPKVRQATVSRWERQHDRPDLESLNSLVRFAEEVGFDSTPYFDRGGPLHVEAIPLIGYLDAAAEMHAHPHTEQRQYFPAPPGVSDRAVAVRVRSTSLAPAYRDGWVIFCDGRLNPHEMTGGDCLVQLADGRAFLRTLATGSRAGLNDLLSATAPPIRDVPVLSASPIVWIKTAR